VASGWRNSHLVTAGNLVAAPAVVGDADAALFVFGSTAGLLPQATSHGGASSTATADQGSAVGQQVVVPALGPATGTTMPVFVFGSVVTEAAPTPHQAQAADAAKRQQAMLHSRRPNKHLTKDQASDKLRAQTAAMRAGDKDLRLALKRAAHATKQNKVLQEQLAAEKDKRRQQEQQQPAQATFWKRFLHAQQLLRDAHLSGLLTCLVDRLFFGDIGANDLMLEYFYCYVRSAAHSKASSNRFSKYSFKYIKSVGVEDQGPPPEDPDEASKKFRIMDLMLFALSARSGKRCLEMLRGAGLGGLDEGSTAAWLGRINLFLPSDTALHEHKLKRMVDKDWRDGISNPSIKAFANVRLPVPAAFLLMLEQWFTDASAACAGCGAQPWQQTPCLSSRRQLCNGRHRLCARPEGGVDSQQRGGFELWPCVLCYWECHDP